MNTNLISIYTYIYIYIYIYILYMYIFVAGLIKTIHTYMYTNAQTGGTHVLERR